MKKTLFLFSIILTFTYSCTKDPINSVPGAYNNGILILNEGSFMSGNATLDFYSYDNDSLFKNVFKSINGIDLGDVAQDIKLINNTLAIVVNNSNKIYWLTKDSLKLKFKTENISSPRFIESISSTLAVVTSMNGSIYTVNTTTGMIENTIATGQFTEKIIINNNDIIVEYKKMYSSLKPDSQGFLIFDKSSLQLKNRINTHFIPESSQLLNGKIYSFYTDPKYTLATLLKSYDLSTNTFLDYPCNLVGSKSLITLFNNALLYYDNNEIKQIDATGTISSIVKGISATYPYGLGVSSKGDILLSDAKNFSSPSSTYIYSPTGTLKKTLITDIATSCFY